MNEHVARILDDPPKWITDTIHTIAAAAPADPGQWERHDRTMLTAMRAWVQWTGDFPGPIHEATRARAPTDKQSWATRWHRGIEYNPYTQWIHRTKTLTLSLLEDRIAQEARRLRGATHNGEARAVTAAIQLLEDECAWLARTLEGDIVEGPNETRWFALARDSFTTPNRSRYEHRAETALVVRVTHHAVHITGTNKRLAARTLRRLGKRAENQQLETQARQQGKVWDALVEAFARRESTRRLRRIGCATLDAVHVIETPGPNATPRRLEVLRRRPALMETVLRHAHRTHALEAIDANAPPKAVAALVGSMHWREGATHNAGAAARARARAVLEGMRHARADQHRNAHSPTAQLAYQRRFGAAWARMAPQALQRWVDQTPQALVQTVGHAVELAQCCAETAFERRNANDSAWGRAWEEIRCWQTPERGPLARTLPIEWIARMVMRSGIQAVADQGVPDGITDAMQEWIARALAPLVPTWACHAVTLCESAANPDPRRRGTLDDQYEWLERTLERTLGWESETVRSTATQWYVARAMAWRMLDIAAHGDRNGLYPATAAAIGTPRAPRWTDLHEWDRTYHHPPRLARGATFAALPEHGLHDTRWPLPIGLEEDEHACEGGWFIRDRTTLQRIGTEERHCISGYASTYAAAMAHALVLDASHGSPRSVAHVHAEVRHIATGSMLVRGYRLDQHWEAENEPPTSAHQAKAKAVVDRLNAKIGELDEAARTIKVAACERAPARRIDCSQAQRYWDLMLAETVPQWLAAWTPAKGLMGTMLREGEPAWRRALCAAALAMDDTW